MLLNVYVKIDCFDDCEIQGLESCNATHCVCQTGYSDVFSCGACSTGYFDNETDINWLYCKGKIKFFLECFLISGKGLCDSFFI